MIYTLTLNPALDETVSPAGTRLDPGGKGLNVSKTLLALGVPSVVLGFTAGAQGAELCRLAEAAGLTLAMTPAPGETRRNRKLTDGPRLKEHNEPGPAFDPAAFAALTAQLRRTLRPGDTLALCGSLPPGAPADCFAQLARLAPACRVVADTSGPALAAVLAARPAVVKPNLAELAQLAGAPLLDLPARLRALDALRAAGAERVLLSLGAEGAMLAAPAGVWYAPAPAVPVASPLGAGDAMTALLCVGSFRRPEALLRACVAAGSAAAMQPGSAPLRRADFRALLPRIRLVRLR